MIENNSTKYLSYSITFKQVVELFPTVALTATSRILFNITLN